MADDDTLSPSESTDSDEVRNDDGDTVVDPPDDWSEADKFGMTAREAEEGRISRRQGCRRATRCAGQSRS
jgi:hypothetical protein